jgi:3-hydroxyacyl-CoA dehydrogenase
MLGSEDLIMNMQKGYLVITKDINVITKDINEEILERGMNAIKWSVGKLVDKGKVEGTTKRSSPG